MILSWLQGQAPSAGPSGPRWASTFSDASGNTFVMMPKAETLVVADTQGRAFQFIPDTTLIY